MRILILTLVMSFLSHSASGAVAGAEVATATEEKIETTSEIYARIEETIEKIQKTRRELKRKYEAMQTAKSDTMVPNKVNLGSPPSQVSLQAIPLVIQDSSGTSLIEERTKKLKDAGYEGPIEITIKKNRKDDLVDMIIEKKCDLGVEVAKLTSSAAREPGLASLSGIRQGDILIAFNKQPLINHIQTANLFKDHTTATLMIMRKNTVDLTESSHRSLVKTKVTEEECPDDFMKSKSWNPKWGYGANYIEWLEKEKEPLVVIDD